MSERRATSAALVPAPERRLGAFAIPAPLVSRPISSPLIRLPDRDQSWHLTDTAVRLGVTLAIPFLGVKISGVAAVALGSVFLASSFLLYRVAIPAWRRWRSPPLARSPYVATGAAVQVVGTIEADEYAFAVPGGGSPAVYARTRYRRVASGFDVVIKGHEEIRGVPFRVQIEKAVFVRIDPFDVRIADRDPRVHRLGLLDCRAMGLPTHNEKPRRYQQDILRAGDRVVLIGRLERQVTPDGAAAPGRGVPTQLWMRPALPGGVWIRR
jgi:hypothetical protein